MALTLPTGGGRSVDIVRSLGAIIISTEVKIIDFKLLILFKLITHCGILSKRKQYDSSVSFATLS
jgi:hypothetical protein